MYCVFGAAQKVVRGIGPNHKAGIGDQLVHLLRTRFANNIVLTSNHPDGRTHSLGPGSRRWFYCLNARELGRVAGDNAIQLPAIVTFRKGSVEAFTRTVFSSVGSKMSDLSNLLGWQSTKFVPSYKDKQHETESHQFSRY